MKFISLELNEEILSSFMTKDVYLNGVIENPSKVRTKGKIQKP